MPDLVKTSILNVISRFKLRTIYLELYKENDELIKLILENPSVHNSLTKINICNTFRLAGYLKVLSLCNRCRLLRNIKINIDRAFVNQADRWKIIDAVKQIRLKLKTITQPKVQVVWN